MSDRTGQVWHNLASDVIFLVLDRPALGTRDRNFMKHPSFILRGNRLYLDGSNTRFFEVKEWPWEKSDECKRIF